MTGRDEAQPKQPRRRRKVFPKRVELRMTQESFDAAVRAAQQLSAAEGRTFTVSDIIRDAVEDGCERLAQEMARGSGGGVGWPMDILDAVIDGVQEVRTDARRIGHNVNQIAKVGNTTGHVPADLAETREALADLDAKVLALMAMLAGVDEAEE